MSKKKSSNCFFDLLFRLDFYQQSRTDLVGGMTKFLFGEIGPSFWNIHN